MKSSRQFFVASGRKAVRFSRDRGGKTNHIPRSHKASRIEVCATVQSQFDLTVADYERLARIDPFGTKLHPSP